MVSGNAKANTAIGRTMMRLDRHGVGRPVTLFISGVLCSAAIASSRPASAQVPTPVTVPNAITGSTTLSGTLNGNNSPGYFVANGGTLTINNGLLENFTTSGGSGSGGGLGAGGAIFIDTGGTVILNGTSFSHDSVIGGTGGTSSPYGGTLNNISPVTAPDASPNGANGANGTIAPDNEFIFGNGQGNGIPGINVGNGSNATNGLGGIGGVGGPGTNGWSSNPVAQENNAIAIENLIDAGVVDGAQVTLLGVWIAGAAAAYADAADPFEAPISVTTGITSTLLAILAGVNLGADTSAVAAAALSQELTQGILNNWNNLATMTPALVGNGGPGETGGSGGAGSYGFGGGAGGQGGAYGLTGQATGVDGTGGNGGVGGAGGFGGGGGAGGFGFGACQNGNSPFTSTCTSSSGVGGAGGTPGFGAGVGSTGGVTGVSGATDGGGGDGYGGAIFVNNGASLTITGTATFAGDSAIGGNSLNGGLAGGAAGTDLFMMTGATVNIAPGAGNVVTFNGTIADNSKTSIGTPSVPLGTDYPISAGAGLTIYAGLTVFSGQNTYSGETVINGGALGGPLNPGTNTPGAPNAAVTDGALQAADGVGLPTASNLNFSGPGQFTGGVLQSGGTFTRYVNPNPNPDGGSNPGGVQWTGSGGFAAFGAPLTVTLNEGAPNAGVPLAWGSGGFVPFGYSLIFGSANSNNLVTFTNPIDITGGSIGAGTAASILVANNGNPSGSVATMSGVISGSGDLSIGGGGFNGTLNLTAVNTYTGATVINSGTLALGGTGSIADSSSITVASTGTFDISQTTAGASITTLTGSGNLALGGQELTVTAGGTFSGVIADGGVGAGTKGSLIVAGGTETLSGTNTYTGDTTIDPGATLALFGTGSIADSTPVLDNGTFDISQASLGAAITTLSGSGHVALGANLLLITAGSTTFSGVIADGGIGGGTTGMLAVSGGTQTLSGINTYTGGTLIDSGATLALRGTGSIAQSVVVADNGTFDISQTTAGASITTLTGSGNVALGAQELTITAGSTTFSGVIADGGIGGGTKGSLIVAGGTETLSGTNTYTGDTTIDPGATLALFGTGSIADSIPVLDNGTFDISQTSLGAAITTLSGSGHVGLGANLLLITAGSTTFSGVIADGGIGGGTSGMLAVGGGTQTLSGTNTYTGGTLIDPGATLALTGTGSIAASAFVDALGTFDISQTTVGASIMTLAGTGHVALGGQELTITAGSSTFSGVIADGGIGGGIKGSLIVSGGTETLSGTNTYTGDTTIAPTAGTATLALTGTGSIATSGVVQIATNGTFDISQTSSGASIMTLADTAPGQSGNVALGAQTLTITNGSTTFSGVIADGGIGGGIGGNLTVSGGAQTLAGVNTYTGLTTIAPNPSTGTATLALAGNGSIATSSEVSVATNGTFDISGTNAGASIVTLSGSGSVVLGSQVLTLTAAAAGPGGTNPAGIFSGIISGLGGMTITGGHEELTGVNTYFGGTTVANGATLSINSSSSLGNSSSTLTLNNGTLVVDGSITIPQPLTLLGAPPGTDEINLNSNNVTLSGTITGPGVLTAVSGGTLNLTGTVNNIGGITLGPGTTLTASASANAELITTPIVVVPTSGSPADVFTGSVHVVGPLDIVNSQPTPELIILPGDTLVGVGSVSIATVVQGGGANSPGDGPGTIVVNAPVTDLAGATYTVAIDGPLSSVSCVNPLGCAGTYSSTVVTGAGNTYTAAGTLAPMLRGISAPANNNYTPPVTTSFVIVQAAGGVLGSFSGLTQPATGLTAGTRFDALYGPNATTPFVNSDAITLYVTPADYTNLSSFGVSLTGNQSQVGAALNALRGPAGLSNNLAATMDFGALFVQQPSALPHDFDTLSGEANADAVHGVFEMASQFLELMVDPAVNGRSGGAGAAALGFAADGDATPPSETVTAFNNIAPPSKTSSPVPAGFDQRWTAWGSTFGGANTTTSDPAVGTHDLTAAAYGFAGGMDYRLMPDTVAGFALGGGGTNWGLAQGLGGGRSDAFQAGLYAKTRFGPAYIATALAFSNQWMTTNRYTFTGDHLSANFDAQSFGARLEAGYRYAMPWVGVTPYGAFQAQAFHTPNYSETDLTGGAFGLFGLNYNAATTTDLSGEIGARFDGLNSLDNGMQLVWSGRAAWEHDWVNNPGLTATFQAALAPGALPGAAVSFNVNGAALPHDAALVSAGADLHVTSSITIGAKFDSAIAVNSQTYAGTATLRYAW